MPSWLAVPESCVFLMVSNFIKRLADFLDWPAFFMPISFCVRPWSTNEKRRRISRLGGVGWLSCRGGSLESSEQLDKPLYCRKIKKQYCSKLKPRVYEEKDIELFHGIAWLDTKREAMTALKWRERKSCVYFA